MAAHETSYTSFTRYLAAKKSVDDRALNQHVWDSLQQCLRERDDQAQAPLAVVEIGGGTGAMVERALARGLFSTAHYTLVDAMPANIAAASEQLPVWAATHGFHMEGSAEPATYRITGGGAWRSDLTLRLEAADCFDFAAQSARQRQHDLLIAHAFLDLVDTPRALQRLRPLLRPDALLYLTINFDGATLLEPVVDAAFDALIETLYHETMDRRVVNGQPSGDSRTGRHLFAHLRRAGVELLDAGSSDWVVFADSRGYPFDEAYFLHFIIETIHGALRHHAALDRERFAAWVQTRHAQIERGELVYIAHQLDFLGRINVELPLL